MNRRIIKLIVSAAFAVFYLNFVPNLSPIFSKECHCAGSFCYSGCTFCTAPNQYTRTSQSGNQGTCISTDTCEYSDYMGYPAGCTNPGWGINIQCGECPGGYFDGDLVSDVNYSSSTCLSSCSGTEPLPTSPPLTCGCGTQECDFTQWGCACTYIGCKLPSGENCIKYSCGGSNPAPTATPVPAFTCSNFVSGSITPNSSITPGGTVTVQCNFGAVMNCITPGGSLTGCTYIGMSGTTASFTCNAPLTIGSYVNYCSLFVGGSSPGCPTTTTLSCADGNYTVGVIPTSTPIPTPTTALPTATPTPAYDRQLHIRGSVVANIFNLLRDLGSAVSGEVNDLYPGEFFEYGTEQIIAFPPFLRFRPTLWTEVSP